MITVIFQYAGRDRPFNIHVGHDLSPRAATRGDLTFGRNHVDRRILITIIIDFAQNGRARSSALRSRVPDPDARPFAEVDILRLGPEPLARRHGSFMFSRSSRSTSSSRREPIVYDVR